MTHIRADFMLLAANQIINLMAKYRYMFGGLFKVPMLIRAVIGRSWGQGAQHSQGLYSMFMHVPGLKVVTPSNAYDAKGCMIAAIRDKNPVIFVEHRLLYETTAPVPKQLYTVDFGKARIARPGTDITIVGISNMFMECMRASEILSDEGIDAEVIDPISLVPLDMQSIYKSAVKTGRLLVVDNAWTNCGASAEIIAQTAERSEGQVTKLRRLGYAPTTCPTSPALEEVFYPRFYK